MYLGLSLNKNCQIHPLNPPPAGEILDSPPLEGARGRKKTVDTVKCSTGLKNHYTKTIVIN